MAQTSDRGQQPTRAAASAKKKKNGESDSLGHSFEAALKAATAAPDREEAWDHLEELADALQRPDEVAAAYREALDAEPEHPAWTIISRRAAKFHDEWFGDNPEAMHALLSKILERDPDATWAFERLSMVLTAAERWDDLLGLYDALLQRTPDPARRKQLLNDAAHTAKDFAQKPGRAVDYMQLQLELDTGNDKLARGIERLLERQSRWEDLVELWQNRLPEESTSAARKTRLKVARAFLDHLDAAGPALEELRTLVEESPGHLEACAELERVLAGNDFPAAVRMEALGLLRTNYRASARPADAVAAVERALQFAEGPERVALRREAGARLAILGKDDRALQHYADLLREEPSDADARRQLRQLARRSGMFPQHVDALVEGAEHAEPAQAAALIVEAGHLTREQLDDSERAIELYRRVVDLADADPAGALTAAHHLNELLAAADRRNERLDVLERLADLEQASVVRKAVLGEAGGLAAVLDDPDRALRAYQRRLDADDHDLEALDAIIDVLDKCERWEPLCDALQRRADTVRVHQQRRADLVRIARIQADRLDAIPAAIDTWSKVREEFGDEPETITALDQLLTATSRFQELGEVLEDAAATRRLGAGSLLSRMGEVYRVRLDNPERAVVLFGQALAVEPMDQTARTGLQELCDDDTYAGPAAETLATAYRLTDEWEAWLGLVDLRLRDRVDKALGVELLREAVWLQEDRAKDDAAALRLLARAFVLDPDAPALEEELHRLAQRADNWAEAATALGQAAADVESPNRASALFEAQGRVLEQKLRDAPGAVAAFTSAAQNAPDSFVIRRAIIRASALAGTWDESCRAAVEICKARKIVDADAISSLANAAGAQDAFEKLTAAMEGALASIDGLPGAVARDLHAQCARWHRDEIEDLKAAEAAGRRAVEADSGHRATMELLADLERGLPEASEGPRPQLCDTLLALDRMSDRDLDALAEAAEVAVKAGADRAFTRDTVGRLYRKSARLFAQGDELVGRRTPQACALWALDQLVTMSIEAQLQDEAIRTLLAATDLALPRKDILDLRLRAARLCAESGDRAQAIELFSRVLDERADDIELITELGALCEQEDRLLALIQLRNRELGLTQDPERRLELRLIVSRLVGEIEKLGGRVEALKANLGEQPGHAPTLDALTVVLKDKGRLDDLADVLTQQAEALEALGESARAAELWTDVAELVEDTFRDIGRAIAALKHVVELDPSGETLDHLARLHLQRDEPGAAASVLAHRLEATEATARVPVLLRLARAQIQAGQETEATSTLQTAFEEAPKSGEVRKLLIKLYREHEAWEPLARTLSIAAEHITDADAILAYAREAAEIYDDRLGQPDLAVPVLEKAHELFNEDRGIKARLGAGLRVAGRLDEAKTVLEQLTADFGRRRSPERAAAHLQLARVEHAQGNREEATDQLERASSMDPTNPQILQTLAEMAREGGQLERAERAYRTLLIQARRQTGVAEVGASEVLYELSRIAQDRDDEEQAQELVESAMEALAERESEGAAFAERLRKQGSHALLERVLDARLSGAESPRQRAEVLGELAQLLEEHLGQPEKALESRLTALRTDPASPEHHSRARELAAKCGRLPDYVQLVERQLEKARRTTDVYVRVELLLRLAEAMEGTGGDIDRAVDLIKQAEELGVREVDVWRVTARLAGAQGDTTRQMEYLERLAALGEQGTETRADALYRMAEVHLSQEDTIDKGILALSDALEVAPRYERACRILMRATGDAVSNPELLALYDRVARKTGDAQTILGAIERRAQHNDTAPEDVREGVDLALRLELGDRAEALMLRAIELAGALLDGDSRVGWALVAMARRRHEAGDVAGAVKWLCEAIEAGDEIDVLVPLAKEITTPAIEDSGDLTLAVKVFEALLERDATLPEVWRPLAEIYRKLGDLDQLARLVDDTIDGIEEADERNALRLELAQTLLGSEGNESEALELLRGVLRETPNHPQAQPLMREVLERTGRDDELIELLAEQLLAAQAGGDAATVVEAALELAERQHAAHMDDAPQTLRGALDVAPNDQRLMHRMLELLGEDDDSRDERAEILERLIGLEEGETAAELASTLAQLHADADDEEAHLRALVLGYQRHPGSAELRARLEKAYESRGDYRGLAQMLVTAAEGEANIKSKLELLRQAATIHRELLSDPETSADILERAHAGAPDEPELALELASALASAGKVDRATTLVSGLLDDDLEEGIRMQLLATRADLRAASGDVAGTIEDLEAALPLDSALAVRLITALDQQRLAAQQGGEQEAERKATLRLCELAVEHGQHEQARELLTAWVEKERKDVEALRLLRDLGAAEEQWEAVAKISARLVAVEAGDAQIDAALQLAKACKRMGKPGDARAGLEHARRKQPDSSEIRNELREIYEAGGPSKELAKILSQDAEDEQDPKNKLLLMKRVADLYVELDDSDAALPYIQQILELSPGDAGATVTMADALLAMGEVDKADELLGNAIGETKSKRSPTLALLFHRRARVSGARGDSQTQLGLLQQAFSADKNNGQIAAELADLAEVLEVWDLAVRVLRTITLLDGPCPISRVQAFLRQAQICFRRGDRQRAVLWARKAKHEDPSDAEVTAFLTSLGES